MLPELVKEPAKTRLMTARELEQLSLEASRGELVQGEFIPMSPAGFVHGEIAGNVFGILWSFVRKNRLGVLYAAETGFILQQNPDTVRAPDVAFVTHERAAQQKRKTGYFQGAPDLAVEVISPSEILDDVENKLIDYLEAGTKVVWLVYPRTQTITIYRSLTDVRILTINDDLDCSDLLPGFSVPVAEIFA